MWRRPGNEAILQVEKPHHSCSLSTFPLPLCTGLEIGFDVVEFEVGEGAGFAEFRLVLFGTLERSINVSFTTLDGTAVGKE